jgi:hypothetical protein
MKEVERAWSVGAAYGNYAEFALALHAVGRVR